MVIFDTISARLTETLIAERASLVGYADLTGLPENVRQPMPRGVSIALALDPSIVATIRTGPNRRYYAEYRRANRELARLGRVAEQVLTDVGHRAIAAQPTGVGIDPHTHSTVLPHKTVATRAGMGWIGKCALLVTEGYGSAVRLTSVLTDAPLEIGTPVDASHCGACEACVTHCPGGAPSGRHWDVHTYRDEFYDVHACREAAQAGAERAGIDEIVCGICIAVCPWTERYIESADTP